MPETPNGTRDYREYAPSDGWITDEARLLSEVVGHLAGISDQIAALQATADRLELGAVEFLPALRDLLSRRMTKAAASAASIFHRGPG